MSISTLRRTAVGTALALILSTAALTPAFAEGGPTITWSGAITDGASYVYGAVPATDTCTAVDATATAVDCAVTGYDTTVGVHTLTATATSAEGTTTEVRTYTVTAWTLKGFYRPVKMTAVNKVKGGRTVPLKFKVYAGDTKLKSRSAVSSATKQLVSCTDFSALGDPTAISISAKGKKMRYTHGSFVINWKTPKTVKATKTVTKTVKKGKKTVTVTKKVKATVAQCYITTVTTADGSSLSAQFMVR